MTTQPRSARYSANLTVFTSLLLSLACSTGEQKTITPPERAQVHLTEVFTIGEDPSASAEYLFGQPQFVRTDHKGNIYIADTASMNIRVFDDDGQYLRKIGKRGRDPGEILDITCFELSGDDLIVADGQSFQITRFSADGETVTTYPIDLEEMLWPRRLRQLAPDQYLFLYKMPEGKTLRDTRYMFHLYDQGFTRKQLVFGALSEVLADPDPVADHYLQYHPGSMWIDADGAILYAPSLYSGEIFRYQQRGDGFERTATYSGYVAEHDPLIEVDAKRYTTNQLSFRIRSRDKIYAGFLRNESRGLFRLSDGRLAHFTFIASGDDRVFGVELFDAEGSLSGYEPLERIAQVPEQATDLPLYVDWKDPQDRFYIRDLRQEAPVVRVVQLASSPTQTAGLPAADKAATTDKGVDG